MQGPGALQGTQPLAPTLTCRCTIAAHAGNAPTDDAGQVRARRKLDHTPAVVLRPTSFGLFRGSRPPCCTITSYLYHRVTAGSPFPAAAVEQHSTSATQPQEGPI